MTLRLPDVERPHRGWSIAVLATSWTLAATAIALVPFTEPTWHNGQWYGLVDTTDAIIFGAVSALLLARGRHQVSWLVGLCAVGGGVAAVGFQWAMVTAVHPGLPALNWLQSAQNWGWPPGTYSMIILVPVLVRRLPLRRVDRAFLVVGATTIAALSFISLTDPWPWPDGESMMPLAIRTDTWADFVEWSVPWEFTIVCVLATIATADLVWRWHRGSRASRRGLGWLAVAAGLMAATFVPLALPEAWTADLPVWLTPVLHLASQAFFPAALLVAVLGQRIAGLEFVIGRATLWLLMTGALIGAYVALLAIGAAILPSDDGLVIAVATAVVALAVTPLRGALQRRIDALVRGPGSASARTLSDIGRRMSTASDDTELLEQIAESVRHALRLGGLAIDVDWPDGAHRVASVGELHDASVEVRDLVVRREVVGRVVVSGRPGELLDRTTLDALDDLAAVVAVVVQLVARTRELTESRARIVEARDEERRALRRELHDGFGPGLAGVGLGLRAAGNLITTSPAAAAPLIAQMADEIDQRVEEVRTLARGLMPPVLDELGLVPALVELAERHRVTGGLDVTVAADEVATDPHVRQALYGIVAEAVRNVTRHADATTCAITVTVDSDDLLVTVDDDGTGIPANPSRGIGLASMRERAVGIGGTLDVRRRERGTRVEVRVPLATRVGAA